MLESAPFFEDCADAPAGSKAYWLETRDGMRIRVAHFPLDEAKGTILMFPGRTEYVEKYGRAARDFAARGYAMIAIDWRGQGLAERMTRNTRVGHVEAFSDYQHDVAATMDAVRALDLPKPYHLVAHSMGGAIGLRAVLEGLPVASAMFSAPMWGIHISAPMRPIAWALSWIGKTVGLGSLMAPGTSSASYVIAEPFEDNTLTTDPAMFAYMRRQIVTQPDLQLGGPTLQWLHEALAETQALSQCQSPDLPCLTFLGGNERIVDADRIRARMETWDRGSLLELPGLQHEVLMESPETRETITDRAAAFFDAAAAQLGESRLTA
ncbi:MAG: alpha/beta hydrolase [Rhodobacteraceae bacterium]|nr:alpha/beta hydrolase [Paracoccaceae bacterium]